MAQFQAAVAQAIIEFERVDILFCCSSEGLKSPFFSLRSQQSRMEADMMLSFF